jgi:hypothetical protein
MPPFANRIRSELPDRPSDSVGEARNRLDTPIPPTEFCQRWPQIGLGRQPPVRRMDPLPLGSSDKDPCLRTLEEGQLLNFCKIGL